MDLSLSIEPPRIKLPTSHTTADTNEKESESEDEQEAISYGNRRKKGKVSDVM